MSRAYAVFLVLVMTTCLVLLLGHYLGAALLATLLLDGFIR